MASICVKTLPGVTHLLTLNHLEVVSQNTQVFDDALPKMSLKA